ncbi:MAG TPA: hypothetical protein VGV08_02125 [Casimicrobiaceae bacterium]|nr:hypothetical protein [Casimicrobiaceae bacterium]
MILRTAIACAALAVGLGSALPLFAQPVAAPAPAAPAGAAAMPKHSCVHPDEFPGKLASESRLKAWQKDFVAYIDCLKKFYDEQQALAKPHVDAANAAVVEYNNGVKEYNQTMQKAKED